MSVDPRAKAVFLDALERPEGEREAFVRSACAADDALAARVRELLDAHGRAALELPTATPGAASGMPELAPGERIGPYRLVEELGRGGFGVVWRAEQEQPVRRAVALKVVKAGLDTREVVARFAAERQALALMEHPGIAKVLDAGATSGRPWFAMELVDGPPITVHCRRRDATLRERLELFVDVCAAVRHAHQKGIIHRDLKPTNILVAEVDGTPLPKVIDFGIAKAMGEELGERSRHTRAGAFVGTPAYMSPEQFEGGHDVDTRSDVYSLGVVLYELLTGATPFEDAGKGSSGLIELQRRILHVEPPRPSARLARALERASGGESPRLRALARSVRGELDWIVMRCLEKDRERRYDSVSALGRDVALHLRGEAISAGPPSLSYRLRKLARRHRAALAGVASVVLALGIGLVVATAQAVRARRAELAEASEARRARIELAKFEEIALFLQDVLLSIDPAIAQGKDVELLREILARASRRLDGWKADEPVAEAILRRQVGRAYFTIAAFDEAEPLLRRAAELFAQALGADHADTLGTRGELAALYLRTGRNDEAEAELVALLPELERVFGPEATQTLEIESNLAVLRRLQGRFGEAESLQRQLLEVRARILGPEHPDTLLATNNLAMLLEDQGRLDEAVAQYEWLYETQLRVNGELHPQTLSAINNLASTYMEVGRGDEAIALLEKALEIKRRVLPAGHPSLLVGLNNLAQLYGDAGQSERAEELLREAVELAGGRDGLDTPEGLVLAHNLGEHLREQGRFAEALEWLEAACEGQRALLGPDHARTLLAEHTLARTLCELDRAAEAEPLARHAALTGRATLPAGHPGIPAYAAQLGFTLQRLGRSEEALAELERAYPLIEPGGRDELWRVRVAGALAELSAAAGREEEARVWRERAR